MGNPSGPGDFPHCSEELAALSSSCIMGLYNLFLLSEESVGMFKALKSYALKCFPVGVQRCKVESKKS